MTKNFKSCFVNDGEDMHERNCKDKENRQHFISREEELAEELRSLYQDYKDYCRLKKLFQKFGYKVEEKEDGISIYKEI